ncbi:hypothetical protein D3C87_1751980 [compost metagenome]
MLRHFVSNLSSNLRLQLISDWEAPIFKELVVANPGSLNHGFWAWLNLDDQLAFVKSLFVPGFEPCYLPFFEAKGSTFFLATHMAFAKTALMAQLISCDKPSSLPQTEAPLVSIMMPRCTTSSPSRCLLHTGCIE